MSNISVLVGKLQIDFQIVSMIQLVQQVVVVAGRERHGSAASLTRF